MSVQQFRELIEQLDLNDSEVEERLKELAECRSIQGYTLSSYLVNYYKQHKGRMPSLQLLKHNFPELAERDLMLASAKAFVECEEQL